jgi:hypothetical protein
MGVIFNSETYSFIASQLGMGPRIILINLLSSGCLIFGILPEIIFRSSSGRQYLPARHYSAGPQTWTVRRRYCSSYLPSPRRPG